MEVDTDTWCLLSITCFEHDRFNHSSHFNIIYTQLMYTIIYTQLDIKIIAY